MSSGYFLGVDVGSASVRAGVFDASGKRLAFATCLLYTSPSPRDA